ncbi:hypothetical protein OV203_27425 [Nannocystis sp. ILAH1]|uniref:hypothetical protein n=1 Tax=unclassified Nannocystis TaxID=2627009 RepID=UPI00226DBE99|nr:MULTISPECIES: hypothetical protein [unclassified Nannocystis]MCY0990906.1 hypothetical protein [Nannocystis sp. ILAH1]MCY1064409.1 hypothetical protein [Nannocystis sp. RBIL2]
MDPKQQALHFYQSLGAADELSRKLLTRAARVQRGRAAALKRKIDDLDKGGAPKEELAKLEAEMERRETLAGSYDKLDSVIGKAIAKRAELDEQKFK